MRPTTVYSVGVTDYNSHHDIADFATLREAKAFRVAIRAALNRSAKVDERGRVQRDCWIKTRHGWQHYSDDGERPAFRTSWLVIHRHVVEPMPRVRATEPPSERQEREERRNVKAKRRRKERAR